MAPQPLLLTLLLPTLLLVAGAGSALWLPPGSQPLCDFELPTDAQCSLQATAIGSCKIQMLLEDNCFRLWKVPNNTSFIEGINFTQKVTAGEEGTTTVLKIFNYKGRRFLIITMQPEETWWQVDVPEGEHNITITGLPGSLNETNPLINPVFYEGCPPPRINYKAFRKLHKMEIFLTPLDEHMPFLADAAVSVRIVSSNKTDFSDCNATFYDDKRIENGSIGGTIIIDEIYSTEFCFMFWVNASDANYRRYACGKRENMTEPPFHPVQFSPEPPVWWVVGLVFLVILLALSVLGPRAVQKGLVAQRRRVGRPLLPATASSARRSSNQQLSTKQQIPNLIRKMDHAKIGL